jgi:hypothetical protein
VTRIPVRIKIDNAEVKRALGNPKLIVGPVGRMIKRMVLQVEREAKLLVNVDVGLALNRIVSEARGLEGNVEVQVPYGYGLEYGTDPRMVPLTDLHPWAQRHGFAPGLEGAAHVQAIIAKKGTQSHPYLIPAFEQAKDATPHFVDKAAREIKEQWHG